MSESVCPYCQQRVAHTVEAERAHMRESHPLVVQQEREAAERLRHAPRSPWEQDGSE